MCNNNDKLIKVIYFIRESQLQLVNMPEARIMVKVLDLIRMELEELVINKDITNIPRFKILDIIGVVLKNLPSIIALIKLIS